VSNNILSRLSGRSLHRLLAGEGQTFMYLSKDIISCPFRNWTLGTKFRQNMIMWKIVLEVGASHYVGGDVVGFSAERNMQECWLPKTEFFFNPLSPELNPICYLPALLGAHHFLHVSRIRVKLLTYRLLMSYSFIHIQPLGRFSRNQSPVRRPVWLWHAAS
jgi:hypothetical protein